jgi:hypothetical protein
MALILSGDTGVPASGMPAGSVIQTLSVNLGSPGTSSTSFGQLASQTMTLTSTSSKVLILVNLNSLSHSGDRTATLVRVTDGTNNIVQIVNNQTGYDSIPNNTTYGYGGASISYLHSPAATSITYYLQWATYGGSSGTSYLGTNTGGSATNPQNTFTLMEIHG